MPTLKDTKRRIVSVKSTQKITRAMKLVSSAKYARANRGVMAARPYWEAFEAVVGRLLAGGEVEAELLARRDEKKVLIIIQGTDRGLCGGLNSNLFKACDQFVKAKIQAGVRCELMLWGKRAVLFGPKTKQTIVGRHEKVLDRPSYDFAGAATAELCEMFVSGRYDRVYIGFNKFKNAMTQTPTIDELLPMGGVRQEADAAKVKTSAGHEAVYLFEPTKEALVASLLKKQLAAKIYGLILEGTASEHAARMTAMDNATNNAQDVIRRLTLDYNRARQAAITKELIEITSGAEAL